MLKVAVIGVLALAGLPAMLPAQSEEDVAETIAKFKEGDAGIQGWFRDAYGYAVFPSVGKGGIGIGGGGARASSTSRGRWWAR